MNGGISERKKKRKEEEAVLAASVRNFTLLNPYIYPGHTQHLYKCFLLNHIALG